MYNWRLLLLAFTAVIQPIASFTERNLVDGRQQCCEHRLSKDPGHHLYGNDPAKLPYENRRVSLNREARRIKPQDENLTPDRLKIEAFVRSRDLTRVSSGFGARSLRTDVRRVRETSGGLAALNTRYSGSRHVFQETSHDRQLREDQRLIQTRQTTQRHPSDKNEARRNTVTRETRNEVNRVVDTVRIERSVIHNDSQESNTRRPNFRSTYVERDMKLQTRLINDQEGPVKKSRNVRRVTRNTNSFKSLGSLMDSRVTRNVRQGNMERSSSLSRRSVERVTNTEFANKRNFRSAERQERQTSTRRVTVEGFSQERVRSQERMAVAERLLTHKRSISETQLREKNVDDRSARSSSRARTTNERRMEPNERQSVTERREVLAKTQENRNTNNWRIDHLRITRQSQGINEVQQRDSARLVTNLRSYDNIRLQSNEHRAFTNRIDINKRTAQTERSQFNDQTRRSVDDRKIQRERISRETREVHSTVSRSDDERRLKYNRDERRNYDERQLRSVSNDRNDLTVRSQVNEQKRSTVNNRKAEIVSANRQARELSLERTKRNLDLDRLSLTTRNYDNRRIQSIRNDRDLAERLEAEQRQLNSLRRLTILQKRDEGLRINRQVRDLTQESRNIESDRSNSIDRTHEERRLHYVRNEREMKAERLDAERRQRYSQRRFTVEDRRVGGMRSNTQVRDISQGRHSDNSDLSSSRARAREVRRLQLVRTDRRVLDEQLETERKNINDRRRAPANNRKVNRMRITRQSRALSQGRRSYDSDKATSGERIYDERRSQSVKSNRRISAEYDRAALASERRQVSELSYLDSAGGRDEHISFSIRSRMFSQDRRNVDANRRNFRAMNYEERRTQSIRKEHAVHVERWETRKKSEQRRVTEYSRLGERFERLRISRRSQEDSLEGQINELRRVSKVDRMLASVRDSRQLQERQESISHRRVNYDDKMRTRSNARRDVSNADHSLRQSRDRKDLRENYVISYDERTQQRVRTVALERHSEANRKVTERDYVRTNQRTLETSKDVTPTRTSAAAVSRDTFRISDQRMAINRKLSNAELTRKQTITMETDQNTWQYLIYTIQAIYLCSIIMPTLMDHNGNPKKKYTSIGLWMPLQKLLKVD